MLPRYYNIEIIFEYYFLINNDHDEGDYDIFNCYEDI